MLPHCSQKKTKKKKMSKSPIDVLKGLKLMLNVLGLFDRNGLKCGLIRIPNFIAIVGMSATLILHLTLTIWFCIEFKFNLKIISGAVSILSGTLQNQLIYICFAIYGQLISTTINDLQHFVQERK